MKAKMALACAAAALISLAAGAQQRYSYSVNCGKNSSKATIVVQGNTYTMDDVDRHTTIVNNPDGTTVSYHTKSKKKDTEGDVTLKDGVYHIKGRVNGKPVDKTMKSDGKPWIQHIGYVGGTMLKEGVTISFGCFRPDNLDYNVLTAKLAGEETIVNRRAKHIYCAPEGAKATFWHCDYYFDPQHKFFAGYKAVEGGPGTPLTTWVLE